MTQHEIISKILRDMKACGLIDPDYAGEARVYLNAVYVASWEQCRKDLLAHNKKKVAQYNLEGELLNTFDSIDEAERLTGHKRDVIYESIRFERPTRKGQHVWQYI